MRHQRVTIFEDDDATPWRVFSNDPAAGLPYLIAPDAGPEIQVDPLKGEASLGLTSLEVGDVALIAGDQSGGAFTDSLAIDGDTAYVGRRALWEIQDGVGGWIRRLDGVCGAPALNEDLSSYTLVMRNTLERARKTGAFHVAVERDGSGNIVQAPTVLPPGAFNGYAQNQYPGSPWPWLLTPKKDAPLLGTYRASDKTIRLPSPIVQRAHETQLEAGRGYPVYDDLGMFQKFAARDVVVLWRPDAGGAWREVRDVVVPQGDTKIFETFVRRVGTEDWTMHRAVRLDGTSTDALPTNGAAVRFLVVYIGPPTEHWPRYVEGNLASLWKAGYDGDWSEFPPRVKYDAARMTALEDETPHVFMRVTAPAKDLREWMQRNLFKPFGWAPGLNTAAEIHPVSQNLPDATATLVTLDDSNTEDAEWMHDDGSTVNVIDFQSIVDSAVTLYGAGDQVTETIKRDIFIHAPSLAMIGEHKETYDQISIRSADYMGNGFLVPSLSGITLMHSRRSSAFNRYAWGPQRVRAVVRRSVGLTLGQWATCGWTWLPDYQTNRRGMSRLMQCVRIKQLDPNFDEVLLEDAGAANTPLAAPTLGTVTQTDGVVSVPVATIPAGAEARVDYVVVAEGAPEPDSNSGVWIYGGHVGVPSTLTLPAMLDRVDVLVRARAEGELRRPSAFSAVQRVTATPQVRVLSFTLELNADGTVTARWLVNGVTDGIRLAYEAHSAGVEPTLPDTVDVDASLGEYTFAASLVTGEEFSVGATPYPGWTGSAVSGTPGVQVVRSVTTPRNDAREITAWAPTYTDASGATVPYQGTVGGAVTRVLLYQLMQAQGAPAPWGVIESSGAVTQLTITAGAIAHTFTTPPEGYLRYFRLVPLSLPADGSSIHTGSNRDGIVFPKSAQAPVAQMRWTDNGVTLTAWIELQDRGIPVTAVRGLTQVANAATVIVPTPTRGPGGASVYLGGTLASGQYEQDATLDSYRTTRVGFEVRLATLEVLTFWTPAHDRNRMPEFATGLRVEGTVIYVEGDDDTISFKVERIDGPTWSRTVDNWTGAVDVALPDDAANGGLAIDTFGFYRVTLYSDPAADIDVDTLTATADVVVQNGTPAPPASSWESVTLTEPSIGSDVMGITLDADAAPAGSYAIVRARAQVGGAAWEDLGDVTADLSPTLSAPPTASTAYAWASGYTRIAKNYSKPILTLEATAAIYDVTDTLLDKVTETKQWYVDPGVS